MTLSFVEVTALLNEWQKDEYEIKEAINPKNGRDQFAEASASVFLSGSAWYLRLPDKQFPLNVSEVELVDAPGHPSVLSYKFVAKVTGLLYPGSGTMFVWRQHANWAPETTSAPGPRR